MKNEKIIKAFAKISYALHHPIKKVKSLFVKEEGKLGFFDKLKLRKKEKNSNDIRIWSDEKFEKILEKLGLKEKKSNVVPKTEINDEEIEEVKEENEEYKDSIDLDSANIEQAVVAYLENINLDEENINELSNILDKIVGNKEKEEQLKSFIKNNINNDKESKLDLLMLMLEKLTKEESKVEMEESKIEIEEPKIEIEEPLKIEKISKEEPIIESDLIEKNKERNVVLESNTKTSTIKSLTIGELAEKYAILGYEIASRKEKINKYFEKHRNEIINGSKKEIEKYAKKLSQLKELEDEYLILGKKISARKKLEAKRYDESLNSKYSKREDIILETLNQIELLNSELILREEKARMYFMNHEDEIISGSKKEIEKYAKKLEKVKNLKTEISILNNRYKSLKKDKEKSYNLTFNL